MPALTAGNLSLSKHSSLTESLGTVGIPSRVQDLLIVWKPKCWRLGSEWRALTIESPRSWHLRLQPAAAKIFWLFCALLWGELPGTGAFSAIPIAKHQSLSQSHLAWLAGTGWIFYLQRPGSTDSQTSISIDGLCLSPFCLKEQRKESGEKAAVHTGGAVR